VYCMSSHTVAFLLWLVEASVLKEGAIYILPTVFFGDVIKCQCIDVVDV